MTNVQFPDTALSQVLVIGISGRIGSGASFVRDKVLQSLRTFQYDVDIIDVTRIMDRMGSLLSDEELEEIDKVVDEAEIIIGNEGAKRVRKLQLVGNAFRRRFGNSILAELCLTEFIIPDTGKLKEGLLCRKAYVIDSLKHPSEVSLLRSVFGDSFWHVGVVASDLTRLNRLNQRKQFEKATFEFLSEEDADGKDQFDLNGTRKSGQRTVDAVMAADYFFANDYATKDQIEFEAARLTRLAFGIEIVSPTTHEVGMNSAYQASLRSACLSRQVGAAIVAGSGELLSTGHNDVPRFDGGLYGPDRADKDMRCWAMGAKCYNDEEKLKITKEVVGVLTEQKLLDVENFENAVAALRKSRISGLIEFSRAVHAEMEALLAIARSGTGNLRGATLYTTTYPCHNCAKHIVASGIFKVVYLEPYEKSLARRLHPDAINDPQQERSSSKVCLDNYGGVAPRRFNEVFVSDGERKRDGVFLDLDRQRHSLVPILAEEKSLIEERLSKVQDWVDEKIKEAQSSN